MYLRAVDAQFLLQPLAEEQRRGGRSEGGGIQAIAIAFITARRNVFRPSIPGGTHRGDFMGIAATGKRVGAYVFEIARVENGKVAERWALLDRASLLQQLGGQPQSSGNAH